MRPFNKALRFRNAFSFMIGVVLLVWVGVVLSQPIFVLRIADEAGNTLLVQRVESGTAFSHRYIHSVAKCPIIEKFEVDDQYRMVLMESWNCNFGAGIATEPPPGAVDRLVDGYYVIENIRQVMPELAFHPVTFTEDKLSVDQRSWNLSQPPFVGETITLTVEQTRVWHYWWERFGLS
ncbi:DUF1850 domain-containing protein [Desmospora activa]|uniref:DUF1850 domain-containing protein n=1 Tax=Desmospora activa TaxID=500615 RepID=UPI001473488A|nr:DUF1850 domain-containing protein [Desmospora activa]